MPHSDGVNKGYTIEYIKSNINPLTVLDVGVGAGIYSDIIRKQIDYPVHLTGVEAWEPYIEEFDLLNKYDVLDLQDIRDRENFDYDLVIFGDVLEHMSKEEALGVWNKASMQAKWGIISVPIIHYHQGPAFGNPYEIHVEEDWNTQDVLNHFPHITAYKEFEITGVFIAKFNN
jgi:hypothetical protein